MSETDESPAGIDLPIPMTAAEAKAVARRLITGAWRERTRLSCAVGPRHARLVPTDPITVTTRDGAAIRCRVLSTQLGGNWATCPASSSRATRCAKRMG